MNNKSLIIKDNLFQNKNFSYHVRHAIVPSTRQVARVHQARETVLDFDGVLHRVPALDDPVVALQAHGAVADGASRLEPDECVPKTIRAAVREHGSHHLGVVAEVQAEKHLAHVLEEAGELIVVERVVAVAVDEREDRAHPLQVVARLIAYLKPRQDDGDRGHGEQQDLCERRPAVERRAVVPQRRQEAANDAAPVRAVVLAPRHLSAQPSHRRSPPTGAALPQAQPSHRPRPAARSFCLNALGSSNSTPRPQTVALVTAVTPP
jgi:hypothetical protein